MKAFVPVLALAVSVAAASVNGPRAETQPSATPADNQVVTAAGLGHAEELRELLSHGGNVRARGAQELPALVYAMSSKSAETVEVMLQADQTLANDSFKDPRGQPRSMLAGAVSFRQPAMVAALLKAGADVKWADGDGIGIAATAAAVGNAEQLRLLLEAGADPNRRDIYGRSPLSIAASRGDADTARLLLEHGAWPYPLNAMGDTALSLAKSKVKEPERAAAMVELLLSHGAPANGKNRPIDEAYLEAVHRGDEAAVREALAKGADVNARRRLTMDNGITEAVSLAVPYPKLLEYLLDHGADINACGEYGGTALHLAAGRGGNRESLQLLVRRGMDVNHADRNGVTPLGHAVNQNVPAIVELLLKLGANASVPGVGGISLLDMARTGERSALIAPMLEKAGATAPPPGAPAPCTMSSTNVPACAMPNVVTQGYVPLVKKGIEGGADVNARDAKGHSLLSLALLLPTPKTSMGVVVPDDADAQERVGRKKTVARYLLEHGADVNVADSAGVTPLHQVAGEPRLVEFIDLLLAKGAAINAVGGVNHVTPLIAAIDVGNSAAANQLLASGADPNIAMARGLTPLIAAVYASQPGIARVLIAKGAVVDAPAESGTTALKAAVSNGSAELIAMLLKAGANADFDAGSPPSPRALSRGKDSAIQALFTSADSH